MYGRDGSWVVVVCTLAAACTSACGVIRHGAVSGLPQPGASGELETYIEQVRHLSVSAAPPLPSSETLESRDGHLREALKALQASPTADAHLRVAALYRRAGVLDQAFGHYQAAATIDRQSAAAYEGLARTWRDWGRPDLGLADAWRAVYYAPDSPEALNTYGTLLMALGRPDDAARTFSRVTELAPRASYGWTNRCYVAFERGALDESVGFCRRALALTPELTDARNDLALAYAAGGDLTSALAEFERGGDEASGQYNLGIVLLAARQFAPAAEAFERASMLRPGWSAAQVRAAQAHRHVVALATGTQEP